MTTLEQTLARRRDRSRDYDIVLWGATGFTGKLVADYLSRSAPEGLRWAIGGRNRSKLEKVSKDLGLDVDVLVGDSHDKPSLEAIAKRAAVVCTTVGPYAKYGGELVAACVAHGTDYCDLTGEAQFIRRMIDLHQEAAEKTGARIVHCCGFDSIPSDLGCFMLHEHFRERGGGLREATMYVGKMRGAFSGGTIDSMMNMMEDAQRDPLIKTVMRDAYALNPEGARSGPDRVTRGGVKRVAGGWTAPFVMAPINTRVVRRSNALLDFPYGQSFRYEELMRFPDTMKGMVMAASLTAGLGAFVAAAIVPPTRKLMQRFVLPAPGEGPSAAERARGMFRIVFAAKGETADGPMTCEGRVEADRDPGYGATAQMLGESAMCLALDGAELKSPGGVLTPASCMGRLLLKRLRENAKMVFEVD